MKLYKNITRKHDNNLCCMYRLVIKLTAENRDINELDENERRLR